jgi:hypothetical protein
MDLTMLATDQVILGTVLGAVLGNDSFRALYAVCR